MMMQAWRCPTLEDIQGEARALTPRGDAWATSDGAAITSGVQYRFFGAVGAAYAFVYQRLCALREEFWCASHAETHGAWMIEYGLPDACDPFPDLCAKVAALGGASCGYLSETALRAGWVITCGGECAAIAGCSEPMGAPVGGGLPNGTLLIVVHTASSPAYVAAEGGSEAGCLEAYQAVRCDPLESLRCLLERIVQAHLIIEYLISED